MESILIFAACYLIGAFPTAYIMAKKLKGVDIREHGSGNVGSTNVTRVIGKLPGIITLIIDVAKGYITVIAVKYYAISFMKSGFMNADLFIAISSLLVVCGHNWPVYLSFKGGKGVATTCGVFFALAPMSGLLSICVFGLCFFAFRIVSVSSMLALSSLPLIMFFRNEPRIFVLLAIVLSAMTIIRHKSNIVRLLQGKENKVNKK